MGGHNFEGPGACGTSDCPGGLACLANHVRDQFGFTLHFGWGVGSRLRVVLDDGPKGLCLLSLAYFKPGDTITVYDGVVLHKTTSTPKPSSPQFFLECTHYHAMNDYAIAGFKDAFQGRGLGSLANHCYQANAKVVMRHGKWPYYGLRMLEPTHLILECSRPISPGEEICIRYSKLTCERLSIPYN